MEKVFVVPVSMVVMRSEWNLQDLVILSQHSIQECSDMPEKWLHSYYYCCKGLLAFLVDRDSP